MRPRLLVALLAGAVLAACGSVGVGFGVGIPIGGHGGVGVTIGGSVPLPARPAEAPASAASAP